MSEIEKEFVPYQESLELKELGFDEPCFGTWMKHACCGNPFEYNIDFHTKVQLDHNLCPKNSDYVNDWISAPTYSQAFRWFREKYGLQSYIRHECPDVESYYDFVINEDVYDVMKDTHEEAELACLRKLIQIIK